MLSIPIIKVTAGFTNKLINDKTKEHCRSEGK